MKYSGNTMEINRACRLGDIANPAAISTCFTKQRGVYFYCISFCLFHEAKRSLFPLYFHRISAFYKQVPISNLQS